MMPVPTRAEVEHVTLELVDTSRPTPAGAGLLHADQRRLVTEVYVPAGTGPFPFIAFSHGLNGHPRKFTQLLEAWAEAGFAVAAPAFPLSNDEVPGEATFADLGSQPGDISFVIDELLARSADETDPLYGTVDPARIGVAGLSLGGATTYGVAFNDCCLDERPIAAMVLDGARLTVGGEFHMDSGLPLLIMHADEDYALPYEEAADGLRRRRRAEVPGHDPRGGPRLALRERPGPGRRDGHGDDHRLLGPLPEGRRVGRAAHHRRRRPRRPGHPRVRDVRAVALRPPRSARPGPLV